jgi:hypothetical protein
MIELPGSLDGMMSSCKPARGPEPNHRKSLAIFISETAKSAQCGACGYHCFQRALRRELVRSRDKWMTGELSDLGRDLIAKFRRRVEAGATAAPPTAKR